MQLINEKDLYDCYEYGLVNILLNYGLDFEYVLSESMNIQLSEEALHNYFEISNRNFFLIPNITKLSEKYFDIIFQRISRSNIANLVACVKHELLAGRVVLVNMDLYYDNSRIDFYKKKHWKNHYRIVTGIEDDYVVLYNWNNRYLMSYQDFEKGVCELVLHFKKRNNVINTTIDVTRLENSLQSIVHLYTTLKWTKKLEMWGKSFSQINFPEMLQPNSNLLGNALFNDIRTLVRSRERYLIYMKKEFLSLDRESRIIIILADIVKKYQLMKMFMLKEEKYYLKNGWMNPSFRLSKKLKEHLDEVVSLEQQFLIETNVYLKDHYQYL